MRLLILNLKLDNKTYKISKNAQDFFLDDPIKQTNAAISLDLMNNCLDTIFDLVKTKYPKAFRPELYIAEEDEANALAVEGKYIVVFSGLIFKAARLIEQRYTKDILEKYGILQEYSHSTILSCLRVYFWRYVILHELYHIWNGHSAWKEKYRFDDSNQIVEKIIDVNLINHFPFGSEKTIDYAKLKNSSKYDLQDLITQQAFELDADASAVCMLVNLLMYDVDSKKILQKEQYIRYHIALIMGALATAFCLFDNNAGADFSKLKTINNMDHPLPSIRMCYAEEIAVGCLCHYCKSDTMLDLESEWQKIVCDVEPVHNGAVDMGQVFYYTAYTEIAQKHLCKLKRRMYDVYDSIGQFQIANRSEKLDEEDLVFTSERVWFSSDGRSLHGWINPATGTEYAIKAKPQPIVKCDKIGRNDPCPCGSGVKYKKCSCGRYRAERNG